MRLIVLSLLMASSLNALACDVAARDYQDCLMKQQQQDRIEQNTRAHNESSAHKSGAAAGSAWRAMRDKRKAAEVNAPQSVPGGTDAGRGPEHSP